MQYICQYLLMFSFKLRKTDKTTCAQSSMLFSGLMMESEKKIFEMMNKKAAMSKYWMPLVWATNIINRARKEALITSDHVVQTLLVELSDIRKRLGALIGYDTVCVPLVYTQVSILAKLNSIPIKNVRISPLGICIYKFSRRNKYLSELLYKYLITLDNTLIKDGCNKIIFWPIAKRLEIVEYCPQYGTFLRLLDSALSTRVMGIFNFTIYEILIIEDLSIVFEHAQ